MAEEWKALTDKGKEPYERAAVKDKERYAKEKIAYDEKQSSAKSSPARKSPSKKG